MIMDTVLKLDFFTIPLIAQTYVSVGHTVIQTPFMHMSLWNCVSRPRGLAVSTLFTLQVLCMWANGGEIACPLYCTQRDLSPYF
jgi:hypothetical protein